MFTANCTKIIIPIASTSSEPKKAGDPFESILQGIPNVILTPHIGGSTQEAQEDIGHFVSSKTLDYVRSGSTNMSVNMPELHVDSRIGEARLLHLHRSATPARQVPAACVCGQLG